MLTNDEYRTMLGRPNMKDAEINEFRSDLHVFLHQFLDDFFRDALDRSDLND